jgi:hypothetical protein
MQINVKGDLTLDQLNLALDLCKAQLMERLTRKRDIGPVSFKPREIP